MSARPYWPFSSKTVRAVPSTRSVARDVAAATRVTLLLWAGAGGSGRAASAVPSGACAGSPDEGWLASAPVWPSAGWPPGCCAVSPLSSHFTSAKGSLGSVAGSLVSVVVVSAAALWSVAVTCTSSPRAASSVPSKMLGAGVSVGVEAASVVPAPGVAFVSVVVPAAAPSAAPAVVPAASVAAPAPAVPVVALEASEVPVSVPAAPVVAPAASACVPATPVVVLASSAFVPVSPEAVPVSPALPALLSFAAESAALASSLAMGSAMPEEAEAFCDTVLSVSAMSS